MSNYVNESLLNASPMRKQKDESAKLVIKWEKSGLLEGMENEWQRSGMATLLENQARQLISESSSTNPSGGAGDEEWSGVALPLVRRVFGNIVAQELVSVQPMNLPSGLVFYLDFKYGTNVNARTVGDPIHGKTGPNSPSGSTSPYGEGGFYGAGRYGYTDGMTGSAASVAFGSQAGHTGVGAHTAVTLADVNFDTEYSASNAGLFQKMTGSLSAAALADSESESVRAWEFIKTNMIVDPRFVSIDNAGKITMIVSGSGTAVGNWAIGYTKQTTAADRGDFEDSVGNATVDSLNIPEVNLELKSLPIVAKTRKLKAVWSPELAQDLNAYHSIDAEAELTSMLSDYISMEIDLEILDMLINDAVTVDYWSAKAGQDYNAATGEFSENIFYGTRFEWYQTLVAKIQKVSNEIHRLTLRGGANFVVVAPKVATILESLPGYMSAPGDADAAAAQFAMGVSKVGQAAGRYTVYKNPYMTENQILVGFRGSNFLETGAVYSPYVPLITTPLVYDPSDFTPRKGVMTRYAKKMIRPEFYGLIKCADLDVI
jgi:hypothetical protein